jgi:hypothetical protein
METVETPWADAEPGWMVKTRGPNDVMITQEVVEVTDEEVTIKVTTEMPGMPQPVVNKVTQPRRQRIAAGSRRASPTTGKEIGTEMVTVGDETLEATVYESTMTAPDGQEVTTISYLVEEVPGGVVKVESDASGEMRIVTEVVEYNK